MIELSLLNELNAGTKAERLGALKRAVARAEFPPADPRMVNNHIHTNYSFSPYSPTAAVYAARAEGLATCGIVDHDSIGGARELHPPIDLFAVAFFNRVKIDNREIVIHKRDAPVSGCFGDGRRAVP